MEEDLIKVLEEMTKRSRIFGMVSEMLQKASR